MGYAAEEKRRVREAAPYGGRFVVRGTPARPSVGAAISRPPCGTGHGGQKSAGGQGPPAVGVSYLPTLGLAGALRALAGAVGDWAGISRTGTFQMSRA